MTESSSKKTPHRTDLLLEVLPNVVAGDLAPRAPLPEEFQRRAREIADSVADVADNFRSRLDHALKPTQNGQWGLDSIEIGFEIAVQAEAGVIIAKATTGATFSAKLVLRNQQSQQ